MRSSPLHATLHAEPFLSFGSSQASLLHAKSLLDAAEHRIRHLLCIAQEHPGVWLQMGGAGGIRCRMGRKVVEAMNTSYTSMRYYALAKMTPAR